MVPHAGACAAKSELQAAAWRCCFRRVAASATRDPGCTDGGGLTRGEPCTGGVLARGSGTCESALRSEPSLLSSA